MMRYEKYHHDTRGDQTYLPKPIVYILGRHDNIKFIIKGKKIEIMSNK